jgi:hypothetical protein
MNAHQLALFDVARLAPSFGERRAARARAKREAADRRRTDNAAKRWRKDEARRRAEAERPAVTCCTRWYPAGTTWTHCHDCGKRLHP